MPITYPPAPPTISGDVISISRFLKDPRLIARRLRELSEQRFIADVLLTGRFDAPGGSIGYEQGESLYTDRAPEGVNPGSEYPLTGLGLGTAQMARTVKWGRDAIITDESIARQKIDPVNRAMIKLVNHMVKTIDSIALGVIASQVTTTIAAGASWTTGTPNIFRDVAKGAATVRALNQGFEIDTCVIDDIVFAHLISDPVIMAALRREDGNSPIYTGTLPEIANIRFLPTPNLPVAGRAFLVDSTQLGGMADENLGGPGYVRSGPVEAKTMREDETDRWRIRSRRVSVPLVLEPQAGIQITGVAA